jgi:hypothetical protein
MERNFKNLVSKFSLYSILTACLLTLPASAKEYVCKIYADGGWQACGTARKGDLVKIKAYGRWKFSNWRSPVGPEGAPYVFGDNLMNNCPHAALIFTMDRKKGWCYAETKEFIANEDGPIFFSINDGGYRGDNSGAIDVYVEVIPSDSKDNN